MALIVGSAHVDAYYDVDHGTGHTLTNGIYSITQRVGLRAAKLFLSDAYATQYSGTWPGGITSLTSLSQAAPMSTVLADADLDTLFLNCFTFNDGSDDLWKFGFSDQPGYLAAEYAEMRALAEHLLTTYSGTGKTFVLQSWEGDWSLINGLGAAGESQTPYSEANYISPRTVEYMRAWLQTKINAIEDARRNTVYNDVRVLSAIELNRVRDVFYDHARRRIVNAVLPRISPDLVSYSAYDTILGPSYTYYGDQATLLTNTATDIGLAVDTIRRAAPNSGVYLGEFGFAELELPVGYDAGVLTANILNTSEAKDLVYALYWTVFDNAIPTRGFYLEKPNGDLSQVGTYLAGL